MNHVKDVNDEDADGLIIWTSNCSFSWYDDPIIIKSWSRSFSSSHHHRHHHDHVTVVIDPMNQVMQEDSML